MTEIPDRRPAPLESEPRRHLAILFTDLSDSTRLSALMEAEVYAELLDDVRLAFKTVVEQHRGTINQFQGDGLQALFGFPQATEHDGRRATEAALDMHQRVLALRAKYSAHGAPGLSVHSGIHAGLTLARQGDDVAGRFELYGSAPGLAKHLSDIAEADQVLVSKETLGPGSHLFLTSEHRLVTLKGRAEPLAVCRVLARTTLRTRFEAHAQRGLAPFIGRRAEVAWLEEVLACVVAGQPRFVAISGPAGVGKSRLAEQFLRLAAASNGLVSRGDCGSDLSTEPLQPFLQMLRSRFHLAPGTTTAAAAELIDRGLAEIDPALRVHRGEVLRALSIPAASEAGTEAGTEARRPAPQQTIAALCSLYAALARAGPLVVFIDDWQWADDATRQVVYAIRELAGLPLLLLVATRPLEIGDLQLTAADVVQLEPFTDAEADATISELLPGVDPFVAGEIRRYCGGNPLFLEELCHCAVGARAAQELVPGGSAWLETLIESRIARMPREQGEILSAAAVIGNVVPAWQLRGLTGFDDRHALVRGLADHDLLFPATSGDSLRFKHGITRDVVYGAIGLHKRRAMHQRMATLIRGRIEPGAEAEACESLAYHYAGAAEYTEAARYAEMAGDKAMATSSIDRARAQYRAALGMLDRLPPSPSRYQTWRSIVRRLGLASVFDPSRGDLEIFDRAVAHARAQADEAGRAYAEYWLAYMNFALGESRTAVDHCQLALQAAAGLGDERLVAQVRTLLGQALAAAGDYRGALELLDLDAKIRRDKRTGTRLIPGVAYSIACKASILGDQGRFSEAHAVFAEALDALPGPGHEVEGSVLCWRSSVYLWQGRWEAARLDALAAQRVAERVKSLYLFAMSRGLGAYAGWNLEPGPRSLRDMAESASWLESRDKNLFVSLSHGWLAEAMAAEGRPAEARGYAARALRRVRKCDRIGAAMASRAMARLAAGRGDWPAANRHLGMAATVAHTRGSAHEAACNELCRAQVALAQDARDIASACLEHATEAFDSMQMEWHLAQALRLRQSL